MYDLGPRSSTASDASAGPAAGGLPSAIRAARAGPLPAVLPVVAAAASVACNGQRLLDRIDVTVAPAVGPLGQVTAILGPNGAGKSLLLRLLAGLENPTSGIVTWAGTAPDRSRAASVGFVFQRPVMLRRSALDNLRYGLWAAGVPRRNRKRLALSALERAGLGHIAGSPARRLSGGEQQRLAITRATTVGPTLLLLDEPTASLDPAATMAIETMIGDARAAGTRILLVTHDIGQARRLADDVLFVYRGRITARQPADRFFDSPDDPAAAAFRDGRIVL